MSEPLHKFPSTSHLAWLAATPLREDKALSEDDAVAFLSGSIVVEEKIDGANLGISVSTSGELRFQNRGNWLDGKLTGQWEALRGWAAKHEAKLRAVLPEGHVVFGEWCYAAHSIVYARLPDWFVAFDVFDSRTQRFWSTRRRHALMLAAGIAEVPVIARGRFSLRELEAFLRETSAFGDAPREGLYLRHEDDDWLLERVKLVRASFTQSIREHWSAQRLTRNAVAS